MGDRRASSSASWLSEGSQRGQGQCSAQSRVVTMHLIVQELLVFLVVPAAIEVPASVWGGERDAYLLCSQWLPFSAYQDTSIFTYLEFSGRYEHATKM